MATELNGVIFISGKCKEHDKGFEEGVGEHEIYRVSGGYVDAL